MSTGTQSSQSLRPGFVPPTPQEPQKSTAPEVLRSGEKVATSAEALADPSARTFYAIVHNSNFVMPNGLVLQFLGGRYVTNNPDEIRELSAIANKPASLIYTKTEAKEADEALAKQAAAESVSSDGQTGTLEPVKTPV